MTRLQKLFPMSASDRAVFWRGFREMFVLVNFWLLPAWIYIAFCAFCGTAHACDAIEKATPQSKCVVGVKWEGRDGAWLELGQVQDMLFKMRAYPELELQIDGYKRMDALRAKETLQLRQANYSLQSSNESLRLLAEGAEADAKRAKAEAEGHWYSSPVFWGIAMFIAGAVVQKACCSEK